ncbi:DNA (cytosine-5-)-methyltransferase [Candidatus Symbiothrix dinenymphae]|nr:DNA (cytosine-5-)-methyltransferase [Candidatus Symbiothrix dinenymphae]
MIIGNNTYIAFDLFSGAGGLSLGAQNAGFEIVVAVEQDKDAALTFKRNHPNSTIINDDIRKIDTQQLNKPFIIFGGPPCQGFSTSNTQTRNLGNKNNFLFEEFVRFVRELSPEWLLFENVEGIVSFNKGNTLKRIEQCFGELGYTVSSKVVCASDYGVPQNRNRFIMVGNKSGICFEFPKAQKKKISVAEAISDLPELENGQLLEVGTYKKAESTYAKKMRKGSKKPLQNFVSKNENYVIERYSYIGQGQNWRAIPQHLMSNYKNTNNCHSGIYKRLDPNKPSVVISNYRKNMLIHPFQNRGLSVREAARLQSFPDTFIFEGSIMKIQQQIGNAVPPLMAEAIFKKILSYE